MRQSVVPSLVRTKQPRVSVYNHDGVVLSTTPVSGANRYPSNRTDIYLTDFSENWMYFNFLPQSVYVRDRVGLCVKISPTVGTTHHGFTIRRVMRFAGHSLDKLLTDLSNEHSVSNEELHGVRQVIYKELNGSTTFHAKRAGEFFVSIDYQFDAQEFERLGESFYHFQSDKIVSIKEGAEALAHPYSFKHVNVGAFGHTEFYSDQRELNFKIRYVNHAQNAPPLYINCLGQVYKLMPQKDAPLQSFRVVKKDTQGALQDCKFVQRNYVQVFYSKHLVDGSTQKGVGVQTFEIEDAKKVLGLFSTPEQAASFGDAENIYRIQIRDKEAKIQELKQTFEMDRIERQSQLEHLTHQNKLTQANLERENLEAKAKLQEATIELEAMKAKMAVEKQKYDEVLHSRDTLSLQLSIEKITAETALQEQRRRYEQQSLDIKMRTEAHQQEMQRIASLHQAEMVRVTAVNDELKLKARQMQDDFAREQKEMSDRHHAQMKALAEEQRAQIEILTAKTKLKGETLKLLPATIISLCGVAGAYFAYKAKSA